MHRHVATLRIIYPATRPASIVAYTMPAYTVFGMNTKQTVTNYELHTTAVWKGRFVCPNHYLYQGEIVRTRPLYQYETDDTAYSYEYVVVATGAAVKKFLRRH